MLANRKFIAQIWSSSRRRRRWPRHAGQSKIHCPNLKPQKKKKKAPTCWPIKNSLIKFEAAKEEEEGLNFYSGLKRILDMHWKKIECKQTQEIKKTREHFPCERILCCPVRSWWWQRFCTTRKKERNVCVWLNYLNFILVPCNLKMQWWNTHRPRVSLQWLATAVGWINSTNPRTDPVKCATKKKSQKDKSARKNRQNQRKWPENHLTKGIEIHQTKEKHKKIPKKMTKMERKWTKYMYKRKE